MAKAKKTAVKKSSKKGARKGSGSSRPVAKRNAAKKNVAGKKPTAKKAAGAKHETLLEHAVRYVKKSGGIEKAKAVLAELEAILEGIIP